MQYRAKDFEILILLYIKNYSEIYSFVITFNSQFRQIYMLKPQVSQENACVARFHICIIYFKHKDTNYQLYSKDNSKIYIKVIKQSRKQ